MNQVYKCENGHVMVEVVEGAVVLVLNQIPCPICAKSALYRRDIPLKGVNIKELGYNIIFK